jgi:hypothetical protein
MKKELGMSTIPQRLALASTICLFILTVGTCYAASMSPKEAKEAKPARVIGALVSEEDLQNLSSDRNFEKRETVAVIHPNGDLKYASTTYCDDKKGLVSVLLRPGLVGNRPSLFPLAAVFKLDVAEPTPPPCPVCKKALTLRQTANDRCLGCKLPMHKECIAACPSCSKKNAEAEAPKRSAAAPRAAEAEAPKVAIASKTAAAITPKAAEVEAPEAEAPNAAEEAASKARNAAEEWNLERAIKMSDEKESLKKLSNLVKASERALNTVVNPSDKLSLRNGFTRPNDFKNGEFVAIQRSDGTIKWGIIYAPETVQKAEALAGNDERPKEGFLRVICFIDPDGEKQSREFAIGSIYKFMPPEPEIKKAETPSGLEAIKEEENEGA